MRPLLDALVHKRVVLRASVGPLDPVLEAAFVDAGSEVISWPLTADPPYAALVPLSFAGSPAAAATEAFAIIELVQRFQRDGLRYLVALAPAPDTPTKRLGHALAKTLVAYAAAHLSETDLRVNLVALSSAPSQFVLQRAAQATLALCSGWLDAVRGQQLTIGGE